VSTQRHSVHRERTLDDEERKLWSSVARQVRPLKARRPVLDGDTAAEAQAAAANVSAPPRAGPSVAPTKAEPEKQRLAPLVPLDRRLRQKLGRGSEPIERRIDLHGLTQAAAHDALAHFLRAAQGSGARTALVITGKGARSDEPFGERGVLRRLVPQWLHHPELRQVVLGFEEAGRGHGGEGALYVRLRRGGAPRKS
jgi:DNA-nicking Smr family endonuclease